MASLIEAIDIKRKMFLEYEGAPYHCIDVEISRPTARGGQTLVRVKIRNLLTRAVFDRTFKAGEKFTEPDLVKVKATYLYADSTGYNFMDQESYETVTLSGDTLGDDRLFLVDNLPVDILKYNGNPIGMELPPHVELDGHLHRARGPRRHEQRQRDEGGDARDGDGSAGAALREGRRPGEGPLGDPRVRRPGLTSLDARPAVRLVAQPSSRGWRPPWAMTARRRVLRR